MYHVELRRGRFDLARVFNIEPQDLESSLLAPWRAGGTVTVEGKPWDLRQATVVILEGPPLEPEQLALGRGWSEATHLSTDVSAQLLVRSAPAAAPAAAAGHSVVVMHGGHDEERRRAVFARLGELGAAPLDWGLLKSGARDAGASDARAVEQAFAVAPAVVVLRSASDPPDVLVWAGMALARNARGVVVLGEAGTPAVEALAAVTLGDEDGLADALRAAGVDI